MASLNPLAAITTMGSIRKDLKLFEILRPHGLSGLATPRLRSRRQHTAFGWEALSTTPVRWEITPANEKLVARPTKFRTR